MAGTSLTDILTTLQQGVAAANNLAQILSQATVNSSSLLTSGITSFSTSSLNGLSTTTGTVTTVNTSIGLTGGPITATGTLAVSLTTLTNSISSDVSLNNVSSYFTGPSVSQGTSGVWFASGTVVVRDTAGAAAFNAKLWDGTTVVDSAALVLRTGNPADFISMSLSGVFSSPSSNIKISVKDATSVSGLILANQSGNAKDSTITVVRIG